MIVKELIARLQKFDANALVAIASYEAGFSELADIVEIDLISNKKPVADGSTYHRPEKIEAASNLIVAICIGPLDPGKTDE